MGWEVLTEIFKDWYNFSHIIRASHQINTIIDYCTQVFSPVIKCLVLG